MEQPGSFPSSGAQEQEKGAAQSSVLMIERRPLDFYILFGRIVQRCLCCGQSCDRHTER